MSVSVKVIKNYSTSSGSKLDKVNIVVECIDGSPENVTLTIITNINVTRKIDMTYNAFLHILECTKDLQKEGLFPIKYFMREVNDGK